MYDWYFAYSLFGDDLQDFVFGPVLLYNGSAWGACMMSYPLCSQIYRTFYIPVSIESERKDETLAHQTMNAMRAKTIGYTFALLSDLYSFVSF